MESKTIRELAEELGVSKTTIRNYMSEEFRARYTENPDGYTIRINRAGCRILRESLRKTENREAETPETSFADDVADLLRITIDSLRAQLAEKDRQLARKDEQIAEKDEQIRALNEHIRQANQNIDQAQRLHAAAMLPAPKKSWKDRWAEKKAAKQPADEKENL